MKNGLEATRRVLEALDQLGIEFMLVGGLSSIVYGIPLLWLEQLEQRIAVDRSCGMLQG
ncbi:MAG: hypothetical protein AAF585_14260 [Verrucomicrobiota bacterium]